MEHSKSDESLDLKPENRDLEFGRSNPKFLFSDLRSKDSFIFEFFIVPVLILRLYAAPPELGGEFLRLSWRTCRQFIPDDLSTLHHKLDPLQFGDVCQRITADCNQIGKLTFID